MTELKVFKNKKNNQLFVALSRKKLQLLKGRDPEFIKLRLKDLIFKKKKKGLL